MPRDTHAGNPAFQLFSSASPGARWPRVWRTPVRSGSVPVITQLAKIEDFPVRRTTIENLESPATVIIRSRIDSQVLEQHVTDCDSAQKAIRRSRWMTAR